jgi:hypothetical protein
MRLAAAVGMLLAAAAFLASLDAVTVRQAAVVGMGDCSVRQFLGLPRHVDFLALGSSRVRSGISTQAIARASGGALRDNFNFGRSGLSAMRSYITFRDAVEQGIRPRFVFFEADLDALQDTNADAPIKMPVNAAFMKYADAELMLQLSEEELGALSRLRLRLLTWLDKVRGSIIPVVALDPLWALVRTQGAPVPSCQDRADSVQTERGERELQALRRRRAEQGFDPTVAERAFREGAASSSPRQQELFFIARARELARTVGAVLLVARHGSAYEPPLSRDAVAQIRRAIPEFVQPPGPVILATWPDYVDATHMGPNARDRYSAWLAGQMLGVVAP